MNIVFHSAAVTQAWTLDTLITIQFTTAVLSSVVLKTLAVYISVYFCSLFTLSKLGSVVSCRMMLVDV